MSMSLKARSIGFCQIAAVKKSQSISVTRTCTIGVSISIRHRCFGNIRNKEEVSSVGMEVEIA